ncbi:MAG: transcription elongation factor GreA [Gammaproteobacteria bacterium RIFCSPHIGHO2_02_FULL_42_13]|nr:MAG: transcription elongation factor GreA [Gammaproteobacteria bacterium RIFCSPHIGHO2_02_FULL_42_13]OGT69946.1 MAG: transcription elongation factor GreA [Gammaproteobacteria bacterium RIFCSPLOWO2_02_FULL_42_9]
MDRVPMTVKGEVALRDELQRLKHEDRPNITKAIAEARAHGDLKENAEYHAARERQSFIEGRIQDIESKLSRAQVIDIAKVPHQGRVVFGSTVQLYNVDTSEEVVYHIVGEDESDISKNKISINSPIARGLIGKSEGDEVTIVTPGGEIHYEVTEVQYV